MYLCTEREREKEEMYFVMLSRFISEGKEKTMME
jgi:hypothetical protein